MSTNNIIIVPEEDRTIVLVEEDNVIEVPAEIRTLEVSEVQMILGSKLHTVGDTRKWIVGYDRWLDNTAAIVNATVTSSSTSCTIDSSEVNGKDVVFLLTGGNLNEQVTVTLQIEDSFDQTKTDTIAFTVVAP